MLYPIRDVINILSSSVVMEGLIIIYSISIFSYISTIVLI